MKELEDRILHKMDLLILLKSIRENDIVTFNYQMGSTKNYEISLISDLWQKGEKTIKDFILRNYNYNIDSVLFNQYIENSKEDKLLEIYPLKITKLYEIKLLIKYNENIYIITDIDYFKQNYIIKYHLMINKLDQFKDINYFKNNNFITYDTKETKYIYKKIFKRIENYWSLKVFKRNYFGLKIDHENIMKEDINIILNLELLKKKRQNL